MKFINFYFSQCQVLVNDFQLIDLIQSNWIIDGILMTGIKGYVYRSHKSVKLSIKVTFRAKDIRVNRAMTSLIHLLVCNKVECFNYDVALTLDRIQWVFLAMLFVYKEKHNLDNMYEP